MRYCSLRKGKGRVEMHGSYLEPDQRQEGRTDQQNFILAGARQLGKKKG
jgi:hypothetical protein